MLGTQGLPERAAWILDPGRLIAAMLAVATVLALSMAMISAINREPAQWIGPPDEYLHRAAARYYLDHWLPPRVGDTATLDSYSRDYGFSYLNETDAVYLLAGKFARLIQPLVPDNDRAFRLFNVLLLAILAGLCASRSRNHLLFAPLLLAPQIWYIFSYFNGDAFPLFLATLIGYQTAVPDSLFNRYLDAPGLVRRAQGLLFAAVLIALLALSKKNYYAFLAFVPVTLAIARFGIVAALLVASAAMIGAATYLAWLPLGRAELVTIVGGCALLALAATFVGPTAKPERSRLLLKAGVLAVLTVAAILPRYWLDAAIQGSLEQKNTAIGQVQEHIAKPDYKPSKIYSGNPEAFRGFTLRSKGVTLPEMFEPPWKWHLAVFLSATAHYGWLEFRSPTPFYVLLAAAYGVLFACMSWAAGRSNDRLERANLLAFLAFSALTIAVAFWHAWTNDFQAQGRYLFPILAMLGICLQSLRAHLNEKATLSVIGGCFILSCYSFVFTGLVQIPKQW